MITRHLIKLIFGFFTVLVYEGCGNGTQSDSDESCVSGSEVNTEVCIAECEAANTKAQCGLISNGWPYPDGRADFWHYCGWAELTATEIDSEGNCTFGETVGRCVYYSGGEGDLKPAGVWCGDVLYTRSVTLSSVIDGTTYLGLDSINPSESNVVQVCNSETDPICSCPCQEDFPGSNGWNVCDDETRESPCAECSICALDAKCDPLSKACREDDDCRNMDNCLNMNCSALVQGSDLWLGCYDTCEQSTGVKSTLITELYQCMWCDVCPLSCADEATPACTHWDPSK